MNTDQHR